MTCRYILGIHRALSESLLRGRSLQHGLACAEVVSRCGLLRPHVPLKKVHLEDLPGWILNLCFTFATWFTGVSRQGSLAGMAVVGRHPRAGQR